jgi:Tfp pilus assembly protein PilO
MNARNRMILAAAGALVVLLLAYFLLIKPRQSELTEVKALVESEESLTQQLTLDLQRLQELQRQEPQLRADLERIRQLIPEEYDIPNFMFQVDDAAKQAGVEFLQITPELPKTPPENAGVAEIRVAIGGEGGYFAIQDFIRRLYSLDRAVRIDVLSLSEQTGEVAMTATARIFFEPPAGTVPGAVPVTPTTAPAPAATPAAPAPTPSTATTP